MMGLLLLLLLAWSEPSRASPSAEEFLVEQSSEPSLFVPVAPPAAPPAPKAVVLQPQIHGAASWYGPGFYGRRTANGETFRPDTLTAAHRTLPFGTRVRVTNLVNGKTVVVRINDRGPFRRHRMIDLAHGAATVLQMKQDGEVPVALEILDSGN